MVLAITSGAMALAPTASFAAIYGIDVKKQGPVALNRFKARL